MIEVDGVTRAYGDVGVLDGVSLSVAAGEFVGLVGPNGAGKTTLLRTVNGVLAPDAGTVRIDGDPVADLSSRAVSQRVATVPQDTTLAFDFPVADVVEMGRTPYHDRIRGDPDAAAAVDRALDRTDTAGFRDRAIGSLSGGERQRVVLARALAQETPALVLDEPTGSLDVNHQRRTLELVRDLAGEGKAVLAAIHDLDLAARFCDRIAVLHDGALLAAGDPADVLTSDRLRTAFGTDAAVVPNPVTGSPSVTPLAPRPDRDLTVHVAGTGEPAARTIAALVETGATVTAGVLPAGDLAATTARELDVETATAPPFEPIGETALARVRRSVDTADATVLAGTVPAAVRDLVADSEPVVRVSSNGSPDEVAQSPSDDCPEDATDAVDDVSTADGLSDRIDAAATDPADEASGPGRRGTVGDSQADPVDPVARAEPETVVATVRRVRRRASGADD